MSNYDDIKHLKRPQYPDLPPMSIHDRAAQFSPFAALVGYDGAVAETERLTEKRREMSEDLLKRARFLVVCGKKINDDVRADISVAKRSKVIPTTLEGVLECGE